ncbi:MAG: FxsA family protein [Actinomycetota bacterium]|nr:FxsA family protein [Actinomycetota bacterium]
MRSRLLLFGYPLLEVATAYAVGVLIGWGWMLLLLVAGIPVGLAVMRNAGDGAMRDAQRAASSGRPVDGSRHALAFVGGLLIMIPGFWTDLVGLLLVIPVTQRLFRSRGRAWLETRFTTVRMPGVRYPSGDVIQGTVIYPDVHEDRSPADEWPRNQQPGPPEALPPGGPGP